MSTPRTTKGRRVPLRVWVVFLTVLCLLVLFFALIAQFAQTRLARKYTGPQYFRVCEKNDQVPYLCISVADARTQVSRIIHARNLTPEAAAQIGQLIDKLIVPDSAQVVGVDHVSALQLNLALDKPG